MINVKDFGAIGDGKKNNDKEFAAALARLYSQAFNPDPPPATLPPGKHSLYQGAERLFVPAGHYSLSKTLDIKGMSLIIEGDKAVDPH